MKVLKPSWMLFKIKHAAQFRIPNTFLGLLAFYA